jgi:hypothetical protein
MPTSVRFGGAKKEDVAMGGRRATSLSAIASPSRSVSSIERKLKSAIRAGDPVAIAKSSLQLSKKVFAPGKLDDYLGHFTPFIRQKLAQGFPVLDPRKEVRAEWSRIKRDYDIPLTGARSQAVEQAVIDFIRARQQGGAEK